MRFEEFVGKLPSVRNFAASLCEQYHSTSIELTKNLLFSYTSDFVTLLDDFHIYLR